MKRFRVMTIGLPLMALVACFQAQAAEPFRKKSTSRAHTFLSRPTTLPRPAN
jgi:hypothetical protein